MKTITKVLISLAALAFMVVIDLLLFTILGDSPAYSFFCIGTGVLAGLALVPVWD